MSRSTSNTRVIDNERSDEWLQARPGERFSSRLQSGYPGPAYKQTRTPPPQAVVCCRNAGRFRPFRGQSPSLGPIGRLRRRLAYDFPSGLFAFPRCFSTPCE
jgi:hypothetical protein